ncbi:FISUMP domain-containing protein [uncultured Polaribacter sp.]|uniref:FISUMP domain-containing protein n=1 Tax=uncultured Polaribacter sp. TaxID=174711 RepID=UPI002613ADD4|nr:FISUMP domain-containing protein [uncultured Polaribacter sp.]
MKKIVTFFALVFTIATFAQAPQGFNYQATVRNSAGELIINTNVYFKFNVIQGSQTAVPIFTETHYVPTDDLGQVNLVIGQGTATTGAFSDLDWSLGNYYLGIELNTGSGYLAMGTTQLLSVPYALYAANSGNGTGIPDGVNVGDILVWDGVNWGISSGNNLSNSIEITTRDISQINSIGAVSGGTIGSDGGASITSKGLVWSTVPNPSVDLNTKTDEGPGASNFSSTISGLTPLTNYFYRAYATNSLGSFYGNTYNFTTSDALPTVVTKPIVEISYLSAKSGVEITNLGSAITQSGIIYNENPQLLSVNANSNFIVEGDGLLSIENLIPGSIYYVRAFAENNNGIAYGEIVSFTTLTDDLTVTTGQFTNLTFNGVEINGNNVNNDGSLAVIERGVIISEYMNGLYLISDYDNYINKSGSGVGTFNVNVSELEQGKRYFYRAYAKNEAGIIQYGVFSDNYQFVTPFNYGSVSDIDQNSYNTIAIGNQVWMAENLKVTRFNNGINLTQSTSSQFWYSNDNVNTSLYSSIEGRVYYNSTVVVANNYNICPQGWRIPTKNDWDILISSLDFPNTPVVNLMSNSNEWQLFQGTPNGFNLKLYGAISADGVWYNYRQSTSLWLSNYKVAFSKNNYNYSLQDLSYGDKGVCIRCIKE